MGADAPARAGGEPAPIGLDCDEVRPPIREVIRLGQKAPHVPRCREELERMAGGAEFLASLAES